MDRPLRFCMITTFYPPYSFGGDAMFVHQLSNELATRGHRVDVIHCIDAYNLLSNHKPRPLFNDHPNVTVHGLKSWAGFFSPLATQQIGAPLFKSSRIKQILAKGFDVIHYHNASLIGGPKLLEYGEAIKLYTMHEYWLICPTHMLLKFNRKPCTERHCLVCTLTHRRPPQWWRYTGLLQAAAKHVDAFIAPSRFSKQVHEAGLRIPAVYLPNFIPSSDIASCATSVPSKSEPYFLFVGRLEKLKGVQTLIPLFRRYQKAQLWIAGTGNYERELRNLAQESPNIRFFGYRSQRELQILYRQAIAVIVPSLYYEVFPLVTIEAFRQKTPILVRNLGGLPEIVSDSGGGFVYSSEEELESAIDQLVTSPSLQRDLGLRGYEAYKQNWTAEAHLLRYFGLIREIAEARGQTLAYAT